MEEDSLVMVADILDQLFHFWYSLSSMVCYTMLANHFQFSHKYLVLIPM